MEPPSLHPKYQMPPKCGRVPSSAAGAALVCCSQAEDASSSSLALARDAAGASPKGCPDLTLLPVGSPDFGNHVWARAVVVQRGGALGKGFASCLDQLNMLCSLGRFIKASMLPNLS